MTWLDDLSYVFGGGFLANAVPHFVNGVMGRPFQSPFAKPPGEGLSSSTVNVLWGFANLVIAYLLCARMFAGLHGGSIGDLHPLSTPVRDVALGAI